MIKKSWLVPEEGNRSKLVVVKSNFRPLNALEVPIDPITSLPEDERWLQIENVEVSKGNFKNIVTVNKKLKSEFQSQDLAERKKQNDRKNSRKNKMKEISKRSKSFDKSQILGLEQIRNQLDDIMEILKENGLLGG